MALVDLMHRMVQVGIGNNEQPAFSMIHRMARLWSLIKEEVKRRCRSGTTLLAREVGKVKTLRTRTARGRRLPRI